MIAPDHHVREERHDYTTPPYTPTEYTFDPTRTIVIETGRPLSNDLEGRQDRIPRKPETGAATTVLSGGLGIVVAAVAIIAIVL